MKKFLLSVLVLLNIRCSQDIPDSRSPIMVELFSNGSHSKIAIDSLIKNLKFITLNSSDNPNSIVANVSKIRFAENRFFILDKKFTGLKTFDTSGAFGGMIGKLGKGPGEYSRINDFEIYDGKIILLADNAKLITYDMDGQYLNSENLGFFASKFVVIDSGKGLLFFTNYNHSEKSKNFNIVETDQDLNIQDRYFPYDQGKKYPGFDFTGTLVKTEKGAIFAEPLTSTIYNIQGSNFEPAFSIDFRNYEMPDNLKTDVQAFLKDGLNYRYMGVDFIEDTTYIGFSYLNEAKQMSYALLNKKKNRLFREKDIQSSLIAHLFSIPLGCYGGKYFSLITPERIYHLKNNKSNLLGTSNEAQQFGLNFIDNFEESNNPIIMEFSFR